MEFSFDFFLMVGEGVDFVSKIKFDVLVILL